MRRNSDPMSLLVKRAFVAGRSAHAVSVRKERGQNWEVAVRTASTVLMGSGRNLADAVDDVVRQLNVESKTRAAARRANR